MQSAAPCGRQSCLQAAFQAAVQQTIHAVRNLFLRLRVSRHHTTKPEKFVALALLWGSQSWLQPAFSRLLEFGLSSHGPLTQFAGISPASCFAGVPPRSLRNSSRIGNGGLKGRLQARLPAARTAKVAQPACPAPDEFLGLPVAIPAGHEAEETLRSPVLRVSEPPERRLQARLPAPPTSQSREGGLKGRLQARLPAARNAKPERRAH